MMALLAFNTHLNVPLLYYSSASGAVKELTYSDNGNE
jgi:hypothetical protein